MATYDWSKLAPFVKAVKKACDSGVMGMGQAVVRHIQKSFVKVGHRHRASPAGGPPGIQRGDLMNRMQFVLHKPMVVRVGSPLPYDAMHEFGGTITARNVKYLPVPVNDAAKRLHESKGTRSTRSLRTMGTFRLIKPLFGRQVLLVGDAGVKTEFNTKDSAGKSITVRRNDQPVFVLKKSIRIPKRPFMAPALAKARGSTGLTREFANKTTKALNAAGIKVRVVAT